MSSGGQPEPLFGPGTLVGHFRVGRLLGRGGMAEVYLARDLELGRRVALKIVLPELIGDEQAVPRLLSEARITAQFSHPHIVTIYEVGEQDGCPFIALEYLEGHTLKQRMAIDPPHLKEQLRIALAIAQALQAAHAAKVLHRDLKPQNVIIPKDGRLRVLDFGLAKVMQREGSTGDQPKKRSGTGTPAYMSPERWRGKACTAAADVWSLGIMLYELVTDSRPFSATSFDGYVKEVVSPEPAPKLGPSHEVPAEYGELVAQCLDKAPTRRPTAAQVVDELEAILQLGQRRRGSDQRSPFRGLLPFSERHADLFYGRDAEIPAFLERLRDEVILPVVGPSGAGKSSFVQAGVLPRLRELGLWSVLQLRPGTDPFRTLAAKLLWEHSHSSTHSDTQPTVKVGSKLEALARRAGATDALAEGEDELAARLYDSPRQLNLILHDLAEALGCRLLLFVDQLEELHTLSADGPGPAGDEVARRFMQALCTAADDPREPVRVVFALRDDFLIRLAQGPEALAALSRVTVIRTPERHHLEEILLKPLERVGFSYDDPELAGKMVEAVRDEPACLPLLQFTTHLLWERRDPKARLLRRAVYDELGGVAGALARHADGVLDQLSASQTAAARTILLRLVTPDRTRRVCTRSTVLEGLGDESAEVVDRLVTARLLSVRSGRGEEEDDSELEIVHESLLKTWQRLTKWIDDSREELAFVAEVSPTAEHWHKRGRRDDELWDGNALTEALWMLERVGARAPDHVTAFLEAGRAKEQQAQRRKRGLIVGAIVLLSLVALALAAQNREVGRQRDQAEAERHRTRLRWAEAQREGALAALLGGDPLVARAKLRGSLEQQDSPLARALWWRLGREPLRWTRDLGTVVHHVALSPDGGTVAAACQDKTIALLDVNTRAARFLRGHADQVLALAYSPDGTHLASTTWSGEVLVWNLAAGTKTQLEKGPSQLRAVAYSPDGRLLATAGADKAIRLWEAATHKLVRSLSGHEAMVRALRFSPDGSLLASGSDDKTVRLWNVSTGAAGQVLAGHEGGIYTVGFSPDGRSLASGGTDHAIRLWQLDPPRARRAIVGHNATIGSLAYTPDGKTLVVADFGKQIRLWDVDSASQRGALTGHEAGIVSLSLGPEGALLATAGWDNTVRLWDLRVSAEAHGMAGHTGGVYGLAFDAAGSTLLSGGMDTTIAQWDVATGTRKRVLTGHRNSVGGLDISPDGRRLASASGDDTIGLWNLATGEQERLLMGHQSEVTDVQFSPDGEKLLSGSYDKTLRLWDVAAGNQLVAYQHHEGPVWGVSIS
ncbi:MAG: protein kinase, partial [Deltaproteobacteria bacterium]|nr:protein kinase [Deltaproteobacteria bacterium]